MANKVEVTCTGRCVEVARLAFEKASYSARPESREMDNLSKRFRLLRDIDATDKHTEAEINLEHALALYEAAFGQEHPAVAHIMLALADVYRSHGNEDSAKYMTSWADEILQRPKDEPTHEFFHLFGMNHPDDAADGVKPS
jgi:hypothetical protein